MATTTLGFIASLSSSLILWWFVLLLLFGSYEVSTCRRVVLVLDMVTQRHEFHGPHIENSLNLPSPTFI